MVMELVKLSGCPTLGAWLVGRQPRGITLVIAGASGVLLGLMTLVSSEAPSWTDLILFVLAFDLAAGFVSNLKLHEVLLVGTVSLPSGNLCRSPPARLSSGHLGACLVSTMGFCAVCGLGSKNRRLYLWCSQASTFRGKLSASAH